VTAALPGIMARRTPAFGAWAFREACLWQWAHTRRYVPPESLFGVEIQGPDRDRAIAAIAPYCVRELGDVRCAACVVTEAAPRPFRVYRVEVRAGGRRPLVFFVACDGRILRFPPGKR
jgi:hypothetical protein